MSKVYLASGGRRGRIIRILEATPDVAKDTFTRIKARDPKSSITMFGAKDIDVLKRTQPTLAIAKVTHSVEDFIGHVTRTVAKMEPGVKAKSVPGAPFKRRSAINKAISGPGFRRSDKGTYVLEPRH